jgi:adenylate kinase family enzyme
LGHCLEERGLWGRRCVHFDFGANLRKAAAGSAKGTGLSPTELRIVKTALRTGALLEDSQFPIAEKVLRAFVRRARLRGGDWLVLNGLPRHVGQAEALARILNVRLVVALKCSAAVVRQRIARDTGGDRSRRTDDSLAAVRKRLRTYKQRTVPLLDHYAAQGVRVLCVAVRTNTRADDIAALLNANASGK